MLANWQDQVPKGIFQWYHITFSSFSFNNSLICCLPLEPPEQTEENLDAATFFMMRITSKSVIISHVNECSEVNTAPPSQKGGNDTCCISCKRVALYINLMQAPHCFQQNGIYKDKLLFYKSGRDQIPSLFRRAWERGDNLAKSKRFPLLLLVSRSLKSSPFACHATTKERCTPWTHCKIAKGRIL